MSYADGTGVSVGRSINELDALVTKYGATGFAYGRQTVGEHTETRIMFRLAERAVRFTVVKPEPDEFRYTPTKRQRPQSQRVTLAEQEERRRFRALVLLVKALLVAVDDKVVTLSQAFLAHTVLPNGSTLGQWAAPQLDEVYASGAMPDLMPGGTPALTS